MVNGNTALMNWLDVADFFRIPENLTEEQRTRKIKNWLKNGVIPRYTTTKVGRDVLFIRTELDRFVQNKKHQ